MQAIDEIMMQRVTRADDQKAFEYLYHLYSSLLYSYIFAFVKNSHDAEDILNECFYELWIKRRKIEIKKSLKAYLYISARNKCINHLKEIQVRKKNFSNLAYPFVLQEEVVYQTEKYLEQEALEEKLKTAIEKLPDKCRYIFYLNRYEGLKYKDIAKKLNLAEATIKNQIAHALKSLHDEFRDLGSTIALFFLF